MFRFTLRLLRYDRVRILSGGSLRPTSLHESDERIREPVPRLTRTLNSIGLLGNRKPFHRGAPDRSRGPRDLGDQLLPSGKEKEKRIIYANVFL
jgi:hypothetical protein